MPLPSSGPLSLNDIQTEFGGTNPIGLNEYYAGGGLVPAGTTGTNGAVPSSGAISIFNFYGTSNVIPYWSLGIDIGGNPAAYPISRTYINGGNLVWVEQDFSGNNAHVWLYSVNASSGALNYRRRITSSTSTGTLYGSGYTSYYSDAAGNTTIARTVQGGKYQIYRVNSAGSVVWSKVIDNYPPELYGVGNGMDVDSSGNIYVLGYRLSGSGSFSRLVKLDSSGSILWVREIQNATYASFASGAQAVRVDPSGNVVISMTGQESASPYYSRPYYVKLDANGNSLGGVVFSYNLGSANLYAGPIVIDSSGNIYGTFQGSGAPVIMFKLNSSLALQWMVSVPAAQGGTNAIELDGNGNIYQPITISTSGFGTVYGIVSLTNNGAFRWARNITAAPTPSDSFYQNNLGIAVLGTTAVYALTSTYDALASFPNPLNVGNIVKLPNAGGLTGYYPTTSATRGLYVGVNNTPSSVNNMAPNYTVISAAPSLTSYTWTTSNHTNPTVLSVSPTINNTAYSDTSTNQSYAYVTPGTYSWIAPAGVTSISVVAVGGGGGGNSCYGGYGGALAYINNRAVTPGNSYPLRVAFGGNGSQFSTAQYGQSSVMAVTALCSPFIFAGGGGPYQSGSPGTYSPAGGNGGAPGSYYSGGGGAGGYSGTGGTGGNSGGSSATGGSGGAGGGGGSGFFCCPNHTQYGGGAGGGVGLIGEGPSGAGGASSGLAPGGGGSYATGRYYGGGAGAGGYFFVNWCCPCNVFVIYNSGGVGNQGAVRIVWPGNTRSFPSTNVRPL